MAKTTGLGDNAYIGGYDLSGDILSLDSIHGGPAALDLTSINQSAYDRRGGERDASFEFTTAMDTAALAEHAALSALPTTDVIMTYFRGQVTGNPCASVNAKQVNYDGTRDTSGMLTYKVQGVANGFGLEWGIQHTAGIQTDTTATNSAGFDGGAATAFGAQLYVQFFSVTGTSCTVKIQDFTSDTPASYTDVTGLTTTAVAPGGAPSAQRIVIANNATVRRWTRVVTTGTFSNAQFAVMLVRNATAGQVF